MTVVLDSWAILALLEGREPAASRIDELLHVERPADRQVMSWINLGEVADIVARRSSAADADAVVRDLRPRLRLELPTEARVLESALIKTSHAMAYADAFAAATAIAHDAPLLTGDPELLLDGAAWRWEDLR